MFRQALAVWHIPPLECSAAAVRVGEPAIFPAASVQAQRQAVARVARIQRQGVNGIGGFGAEGEGQFVAARSGPDVEGPSRRARRIGQGQDDGPALVRLIRHGVQPRIGMTAQIARVGNVPSAAVGLFMNKRHKRPLR